MYFKILKAHPHGMGGGERRYETIDKVLNDVSYHRGWDSKAELHTAIKSWAERANPGDIFTTNISAIIALGPDRGLRTEDICRYCDFIELTYGNIDPVESGDIEQIVSCPRCGRRWKDVFVLARQIDLGGTITGRVTR